MWILGAAMQTFFLKNNFSQVVISSNDPHQKKDSRCLSLGPNNKRVSNITTGGLEVDTVMQADFLKKNIPHAAISPNDPHQRKDSMLLPRIRLPPPVVFLGLSLLLYSSILTSDSIYTHLAEAPQHKNQAIFTFQSCIP